MKDESIKVSVIIPVYNSERYLKACIDSVLSQTLRDIEVVVVDDGSTDRSWEIIQGFAEKDKRIVAINQRNKGVSVARNVGLKQAIGEYIGFVDSDDFIDPNYFEELYKTAQRTKADIVSAYVKTEDEGRERFYNYSNKQAVANNKASLKGVIWLNIYRRSMISKNGIFFAEKLRTAEDNLFNLQASYYANAIVSIDEGTAYYHHVTRDGSLMTQQYDDKNILPLSEAVLETVKTINLIDGYDKDIYISRVLDVFDFFYKRFTNATSISNLTRLRVSNTFVGVWRHIKYREEFLDILSKKEIDPRTLMYGRLYRMLYDRHVVNRNNKRGIGKVNAMGLFKKSAKAILPHGVVVLYKKRLEVVSKIQMAGGSASLDDNKIAVIIPFQNIVYGDLLRSAINDAGYEATDAPSNARYIWLHWYESGITNYSDFINKLSAINTWKEQGRKVIVHVHNKQPHESPVPSISHSLVTTLVDTADRVVIMCEETKDVLKDKWYYRDDFSRVSLVPHPNYIDTYGKKLKNPPTLKNDTLKILFFGLVRPYKGIEHLIRATEGLKNVEISIYGKPKDDAYVEEIKNMCVGRSNVNFRLEFIPDEDIPKVFADHHVVALPYSIESSLNSGAAILALSYARTIVGTNNGTLKDLEDQSLYFGYDYKDSEDHVKQLRRSISQIQKEYGDRYNDLLEVGERAYKSMAKNNSLEVVAKSVDDMIKQLG